MVFALVINNYKNIIMFMSQMKNNFEIMRSIFLFFFRSRVLYFDSHCSYFDSHCTLFWLTLYNYEISYEHV